MTTTNQETRMQPDTIKRWFCPECEQEKIGKHRVAYMGNLCPGLPVEHTYVAVDALQDVEAVSAMSPHVWDIDADDLELGDVVVLRGAVRAAIAAATGETS